MTALPAPPSAPVLRIASKRSGIDRVWGTALAFMVLVMGALVAAIALLAANVDEPGLLLMFVPVAPFLIVILVTMALTWRKLRSITTPIELDRRGLVLHAPQGEVRCPWEAVASIGFDRNLFTRILVIRLHPQAGPDAPGIESTVPARLWRTIRRHGLRYARWLLDIEDHQLAAAIADLSGGRVQLGRPD